MSTVQKMQEAANALGGVQINIVPAALLFLFLLIALLSAYKLAVWIIYVCRTALAAVAAGNVDAKRQTRRRAEYQPDGESSYSSSGEEDSWE